MRRLLLMLPLVMAACATALPPPIAGRQPSGPELSASQAATNFIEVVRNVEPVAEQVCRRNAAGINCDFLIVVDRNARAGPNAFQSLDEAGRPVVIFTVAMIAQARNGDELAFVLGHEAAHHIAGHLSRQAANAAAAAEIFAQMATSTGGTASDVASAKEIGAAVGARSYSMEFELEADGLGTIIAVRAGYDAERGAAYFTRIPDPGNRFLGSHPPNAARIEVVRDTARRMGQS